MKGLQRLPNARAPYAYCKVPPIPWRYTLRPIPRRESVRLASQRVFPQGYCGGHEARDAGRRKDVPVVGAPPIPPPPPMLPLPWVAPPCIGAVAGAFGLPGWLIESPLLALLFLWRFFFLTEMIGVSSMPLSCRPVALGRGRQRRLG